jgi:hypothetical protein
VVFNNNQVVIHIDQNHKIINQFRIDHQRFVKDYRTRLKKATSQGGWINCFGSVFFDNRENLCLCYYNRSLNVPEIFRYKKNGNFLDTLRTKHIKTPTNLLIRICDSNGNFYSLSQQNTKIEIFRLNYKKN